MCRVRPVDVRGVIRAARPIRTREARHPSGGVRTASRERIVKVSSRNGAPATRGDAAPRLARAIENLAADLVAARREVKALKKHNEALQRELERRPPAESAASG